jgi:glycosyltransferase involved in cell wall biosynthesis
MRSASAYVLSSNYEGWGRVLIESLVAQLPIVTTDVGCAGEVVIHNHHGLVVPVDSEAELAQAMLTLAIDTACYTQIKKNLLLLDTRTIPGTDSKSYALHWADIFGR